MEIGAVDSEDIFAEGVSFFVVLKPPCQQNESLDICDQLVFSRGKLLYPRRTTSLGHNFEFASQPYIDIGFAQ